MSDQAGNNRRLTEAEEKRGAELFAAGRSESDVADALGCSRSTAHRLRERLEAAQDDTQDASDGSPFELTEHRVPWPEGVDVITMRGIPRDDADSDDSEQDAPAPNEADTKAAAARVTALRELGAKRDELAEIVTNHAARAQASRAAIAALDRERLELLAASQDAAPLRPRRADAAADLADSEQAAALIGPQLAEVETMIAGVLQEELLAAQQADQARAAARGARLAPKVSAALRAAVTGDGTVRALADLGSQLTAAEAVAGRSWDDEVVPPVLPGHPRDDWHRSVYDLWRAARRGDVAACQSVVPRCVPWQDRDPGEFERMRAEVAANATRMQQMMHENAARLRQHTHGGASMLPELPNPLPGAVHSARTGW